MAPQAGSCPSSSAAETPRSRASCSCPRSRRCVKRPSETGDGHRRSCVPRRRAGYDRRHETGDRADALDMKHVFSGSHPRTGLQPQRSLGMSRSPGRTPRLPGSSRPSPMTSRRILHVNHRIQPLVRPPGCGHACSAKGRAAHADQDGQTRLRRPACAPRITPCRPLNRARPRAAAEHPPAAKFTFTDGRGWRRGWRRWRRRFSRARCRCSRASCSSRRSRRPSIGRRIPRP